MTFGTESKSSCYFELHIQTKDNPISKELSIKAQESKGPDPYKHWCTNLTFCTWVVLNGVHLRSRIFTLPVVEKNEICVTKTKSMKSNSNMNPIYQPWTRHLTGNISITQHSLLILFSLHNFILFCQLAWEMKHLHIVLKRYMIPELYILLKRRNWITPISCYWKREVPTFWFPRHGIVHSHSQN